MSQKGKQRARPHFFGWEAKKYRIIALIGFCLFVGFFFLFFFCVFFFFFLMNFKNPNSEGANCPNLGSHKADLCNQPLIDRDLL